MPHSPEGAWLAFMGREASNGVTRGIVIISFAKRF